MESKRRIAPPVWALIALTTMAVLHRLWPVAWYLEGRWRLMGLAPCLLGFVLLAVSARTFGKVGTGLVPFEKANVLVTSGFFRYSRNPMYLGMTVILLGVSMLFGTLGTLVPVPLFIWVIQRRFIFGEERFMEAAFGQEYRDYMARVRRWL